MLLATVSIFVNVLIAASIAGFPSKCIANLNRIFRKSPKEKCKCMHVSIHYCYSNIRSWFIEICSRWR